MVIVILESFVIMLTTFFVCSQAFWWSSPTTEPTPAVKQIPVGYFRTYTYQPLSYPPSYYPYGGGSHHSFTAGSGPFGSWSQRQSFSNNPTSSSSSSSPGLSALKLQAPQPVPITTQTPPPPPPPQPQPQPTQPPTQSPPTQYIHHINPSTSQSQTGPVQPQPYSNLPIVEAHPPSSSLPNIQLQSSSLLSHQSQIMNNNNNNNNNGFQSSHSLPQYYQSPSLPNQDLTQNYHNYYSSNLPVQQIQFVPCMCPVSVSISSSEYPENRSDHLVEDESLLERNDQNLKDETL